MQLHRLPLAGMMSVALVLVLSEKLFAETAELTPVDDTFISEHFDVPNGAALDLVIGVQGANADLAVNRGLIRFNVASIPANAVISSATLRLVASRSSPGPASNFDLHRLLVPWDELDATWTVRIEPDENWASPGGAPGTDFSAAASGSQLLSGAGTFVFSSSPGMVADVAHWVSNPGENFGWLVKSQNENTGFTAKRFASVSGGPSAPRLTVEFTIPVQPPSIDSVNVEGSQFCLQFQGRAGKSYVLERRSSVNMGDWTVVTTSAPATADGPVTLCDDLAGAQNFYRIGEL